MRQARSIKRNNKKSNNVDQGRIRNIAKGAAKGTTMLTKEEQGV